MSEIVVDRVWQEYGDNIVLEDISLTVASRAFIALVGPSGCGKSTLMKLATGLQFPRAGTVSVF